VVLNCPTCSGGAKVGYVGSNSGTLQFNGVSAIAPGRYSVTICYLNGDAVRYALLSVNGSQGTPLTFPSTGSFQTVGSLQTTISLNTGNNTLEFYNPIVGSWAPDFDRIQFNCPTCTVSAPTPTPMSDGASNITSSSATLNGTVNPNALATTVHFQYGTRTNYGSTTANQTFMGNTTQSVSANITRLRPSTRYHFRLVETSNGVTTYGSDRTFRTFKPTGAPVVATSAATNVASFSATLNGSVYPHGLTTTVYFQYGTTTSYGLTTALQSRSGNTYQNISANIGGLTANTVYHFRIAATNAFGTRFGADQTFSTLSPTGAPVVVTNFATNVASSSATLNGSLDPHGLATNVYFQYGTTTGYGHTTPIQSQTGNTFRDISAHISSLGTHTTYHFRIVATNSAGTRYGGDRAFTTP